MLTIKKIKLIVLFTFINSFIFSQEADSYAVEVGIDQSHIKINIILVFI